MLLIKGDCKGISSPPGFGGRRLKKSLLLQIFKIEPSQGTPGGEIFGNSIWGDQVLGLNSSVGDFPRELGAQHPALGCCCGSPAPLACCGTGLVRVGGEARCGVASPSPGFHTRSCPAGVTM